MEVLRSRDDRNTGEEQSTRRRLGWFRRTPLIPLISLALASIVLFGSLGLAAPARAEATVYRASDGCYYDYTYVGAYLSYRKIGCEFYWGGVRFYNDYDNNRVLFVANGRWYVYRDYVNSNYAGSYGSNMGNLLGLLAARTGTAAY